MLICFDGSEGASHAIDEAGRLFPGEHAVVVHVWHMPNLYTAGYAGAPLIPADVEQEVENVATQQANEVAERGAELARKAGLDAEGFAYATASAAWRRLIGAAEDVHAKAIVCGSRGRGEIKSLVLGSTSQALAHHAMRPLVIVPPKHRDEPAHTREQAHHAAHV